MSTLLEYNNNTHTYTNQHLHIHMHIWMYVHMFLQFTSYVYFGLFSLLLYFFLSSLLVAVVDDVFDNGVEIIRLSFVFSFCLCCDFFALFCTIYAIFKNFMHEIAFWFVWPHYDRRYTYLLVYIYIHTYVVFASKFVHLYRYIHVYICIYGIYINYINT